MARLVLVLVAVVASLLGSGASAQEPTSSGGEGLIAACVTAFESPLHVEYFTEQDLTEVQSGALADVTYLNLEFVRFPDANGSCLTQNGVLLPEYVGDVMICQPNAYGVLVPQAVITHYLVDPFLVVLADPTTGACPSSPDEPWYVPLAWYCRLTNYSSAEGTVWDFYGTYGTEVGVGMLEAEGVLLYRVAQGTGCVEGTFASEEEALRAVGLLGTSGTTS